MVLVDVRALIDLHKNITGKNRAGRLGNHPFTPNIYPPFGEINRKGNFRVHGPQKFYIFFLRPGFYLHRVIIHRLRIPKMPPIVNVGTLEIKAAGPILQAGWFLKAFAESG
jgi:hypothetical protein